MAEVVDRGTLGALLVALSGIGLGLLLDGGKLAQLLQPTAGLIVFGGTIGAVMVQFPFSIVGRAAAQLKPVFLGEKDPASQLISDLPRYAAKARRNGLVS